MNEAGELLRSPSKVEGSIYLLILKIDAPLTGIVLFLVNLCNDTTNDIMYAEGRRTGLYRSRG